MSEFLDFISDSAKRRTRKAVILAEKKDLYIVIVSLTRYSHPQIALILKAVLQSRTEAFNVLHVRRHDIAKATRGKFVLVKPNPLEIRVTCPVPIRPSASTRGLKDGAPYANFEEGRSWLQSACQVLAASVAAALGSPQSSTGQSGTELLEAAVRRHQNDSHAISIQAPSAPADPLTPTPQDDRATFCNGLSDQEITIAECPVCNRPVRAPGRTRHQQCENRESVRTIPEVDSVGTPSAAAEEYRRLVAKVEQREMRTHGRRREAISRDPIRYAAARQAVLLRCLGRCENPACGGQPADVTDAGQAILEVDHIQRIAEGGRDHPNQMIALCPNCHAMKERGRNRGTLQVTLAVTADRLHDMWVGNRL